MDSPHSAFLSGHKQVGRVDFIAFERRDSMSCNRVHFLDTIHFITPEIDAKQVVGVCQRDIHGIPLYAEATTRQFHIIAYI